MAFWFSDFLIINFEKIFRKYSGVSIVNIKNKQISVEALYTFKIVGSTWNISIKNIKQDGSKDSSLNHSKQCI